MSPSATESAPLVATFELERTVPRQVARNAPARWPAARPGPPATGPGDSLRDDAWLLAAVVGAMTINLVPAAWVVVGRASGDFFKFAGLVALSWTLTTTLQIAVLRAVRARRQPAPLQLASVALVGGIFSLVVSSPLNPYAERLGLTAVDAWGSGVYTAWTSVLVGAFLVWHREGRHRQAQASLRLRSVQHAQLAARRGLIESQLQAVQARIDPQHFFDTLDAIERLYRDDCPRAEALFDELVVFLRTALPTLHGDSSVLGRELDLASACVRLHTLASGEAVALQIDAAASLRRLAFPPGLVLPLLRDVLGAGAQRISLAARFDTDGARPRALVLSITAGRAPDEATLRRVQASLRSMFGGAATLVCDPPRDQRFTTRMQIAHERL